MYPFIKIVAICLHLILYIKHIICMQWRDADHKCTIRYIYAVVLITYVHYDISMTWCWSQMYNTIYLCRGADHICTIRYINDVVLITNVQYTTIYQCRGADHKCTNTINQWRGADHKWTIQYDISMTWCW